MKHVRYLLPVLVGLLLPVASSGQRSDLLPPVRRAATVEKATALLEKDTVAAVLPTVKNPFAPPDFDRVDPVEEPPVAGPAPRIRSTREILEMIANNINPTGTMFVRDEPILLFGARQMRLGDRLTATIGGAQYSIVISGIERTSFTIRLNNEQISRPIKPGTQK
jgi:hypothetical protein